MPAFVGGSILGAAAIGGVSSAYGASQQQSKSASEAKKQRKYQTIMSNTAHQREVKDLRQAGLNPLLSINKGASSPAGAMGQAQNIAGSGVTTALLTARAGAEIKNIQANTNLTNAQKDAISPLATAGEAGTSLWEWIKEKVKKGATNIEKLVEEFYQKQSQINPSSAKGNLELHSKSGAQAIPLKY